MANEARIAQELVATVMAAADRDPNQDKDALGRALIAAVLSEYAKYRSASDVAAELQYLTDNLGEDQFVITRGC